MWAVHPVLGTVTLVALFWLASRGLVARRGVPSSAAARRAHRRFGPWVLAAMWVTALGGTGSTLLLRADLTLGETWHLGVGWAVVAAMSATALATRAFVRAPWVRQVHLVVGLGVSVLGVLQGVLGIELLP